MACFGSPKFDRREPLHILSADSRFPDISPGKQLSSGNHFLAMFPSQDTFPPKTRSKRVMRGGGGSGSGSVNDPPPTPHHPHTPQDEDTSSGSSSRSRLGRRSRKFGGGNRHTSRQVSHHRTTMGRKSTVTTTSATTKDGLGIWVFSFCWNQLRNIWHGMK
mmetsp:Transcript_25628/g.33454  ORF Transcript_25628/g.33454 Transcript_25628/m.33454 type:complete len:161 (+) Transcript_25628:334-816(+)